MPKDKSFKLFEILKSLKLFEADIKILKSKDVVLLTWSDSAIPYQFLTSLMYVYPITQVQWNSTHEKELEIMSRHLSRELTLKNLQSKKLLGADRNRYLHSKSDELLT